MTDFLLILGILVAIGGGVSEPALEAVFPGHGAYISGVLTLVGILSSIILAKLSAQAVAAKTPAAAIISDAPVVNEDGTTVGVNVSTSSTVPIKAPAPAK